MVIKSFISDRRNNVLSSQITENLIKNLINSFYAKIKEDSILGPIFQDKIKDNWNGHLEQMYNFWSGILLSSGNYKGSPLIKHINLPIRLEKAHFTHWLSLFEKNAYENCSYEIAEIFINKARKISESLIMGINYYKG